MSKWISRLRRMRNLHAGALWVKSNAHVLRVLGGVFFLFAVFSGLLWVAGSEIEPIAFLLCLISSLFLALPSVAEFIVPDRKPVKDMTFNELLDFILQTHPKADWCGTGSEWTSEVFLEEEPRLRFRANYTDAGVQNDDYVDKWANCHPDPKATGYWYDLYIDGNLVRRFILVSVDGARAAIPPPDWQSGLIRKLDYKVAQIHDNSGSLDQYIGRSGLQVEQ